MSVQRSSETLAALELMKELDGIQDEPCVGLFWYDPQAGELFGVRSSIATGLLFKSNVHSLANVRTGAWSFERAWEKEKGRGKDDRFEESCDSFPRGRVVQIENVGFKVYTGDWIAYYPSAKGFILEEFQLPEDRTEFICDISLAEEIW